MFLFLLFTTSTLLEVLVFVCVIIAMPCLVVVESCETFFLMFSFFHFLFFIAAGAMGKQSAKLNKFNGK